MAIDGALVERVGAAGQQVYRELAQRSGGSVTDRNGLTMVTGAHASPVVANTAFRTAVGTSAADTLDAISQTFRPLARWPSLITNPETDADIEGAASAEGWTLFIELTEMVCEHRPSDASINAELVEVLDNKVHAEMREVLAEGFGDGEAEIVSMVQTLFADTGSLDPPDIPAVVAYLDGTAAAAGVLYCFEGVGVVGMVATIPSARRRGLGDAVTRWLTVRAFEIGCDVACLEASPEGRGVYERVGFQGVGRRHVWLHN